MLLCPLCKYWPEGEACTATGCPGRKMSPGSHQGSAAGAQRPVSAATESAPDVQASANLGRCHPARPLYSEYTIEPISYHAAMKMVVEHHYLHRKAPCSQAFGLFRGGQCVGVVTYGTPSSAPLRRGLAGDENTHNILELTRLWVCDSVPKNGESYLIGNTVRHCRKEIIVSFADTAQDHIGTVYQATNWLYTGLSAKRTNWTVSGVEKHCQTIADKFTSVELREQFGDDFSLQPRSRKHRYIFINAPKIRRKQLLREIRYPILPYPKNLTFPDPK